MKISIKLIFLFFLLKSIVCNSDEYTKDIMQSSFITFNAKNYNKITFQNEIENKEISKKLLFIYTPGSLNDDRMDGICSTYNEFAYLSEIFYNRYEHELKSTIVEGILRLILFVGYIWLIGQFKDIKRVFGYHGAEHMTVHLVEKNDTLSVSNVKKYPPEHA